MGNEEQDLELSTMVFNTFVWMQIFNEFNNRRLDNKFNIFTGIHRNYFFIGINCIMVGAQIAHHVGGPFRTVYRAVKRFFSRVWAKTPSIRKHKKTAVEEQHTEETKQVAAAPPVIVTEDVPEILVDGEPRDVEKGVIR